MLKIFRKIRHGLLIENRLTRYLVYALGEIVLVVIGILIALRINIANEAHKSEQIVHSYLTQLNEEIQTNQSYISFISEELKMDLNSCMNYMSLINTRQTNQVQDTSLYNMFNELGPYNWTPLESSTFQDFNSSGYINQIEDEQLKRNVFRIQNHVNRFNEIDEQITEAWNHLAPYYFKFANLSKMRDSISVYEIPKTYTMLKREAFINNQEFNNLVTNRMMRNVRSTNSLEYLSRMFADLKDEIDQYLKAGK